MLCCGASSTQAIIRSAGGCQMNIRLRNKPPADAPRLHGQPSRLSIARFCPRAARPRQPRTGPFPGGAFVLFAAIATCGAQAPAAGKSAGWPCHDPTTQRERASTRCDFDTRREHPVREDPRQLRPPRPRRAPDTNRRAPPPIPPTLSPLAGIVPAFRVAPAECPLFGIRPSLTVSDPPSASRALGDILVSTSAKSSH